MLECLIGDFVLDNIPDVTLVDELVFLGDLAHDLKDDLLAVPGELLESLIACPVVYTSRCTHSIGSSSHGLRGLAHQCATRKYSLLADAVSHEHLQQMVRHLVKLLNLLNMRANDCLLLLKDSDGPIDLHIHETLIVEIFESHWNLVFSLLVEDNLEYTSVVRNLEECAHGLLLFADHAAHDNDLIDLISIDLADVIGLRLGLLDHFKGDGSEDAVFPPLPAKFASHSPLATLRVRIAVKVIVEAGCSTKARSTNVVSWVEEALILTREHRF